MIDAHKIGITLALDNGVSEGLATIRRDLSPLNDVVEGSATRLRHLARAAADLGIGSDATEPVNKSSTPPAHGRGREGIPPRSISSPLDLTLFGMRGPDLVWAAKALIPVFFLPAAQSVIDDGMMQVDPPGVESPKVPSLGVPNPASITGRERDQGASIAQLARVGYTAQIPSSVADHAVPGDGLADRHLMTLGTARFLSAGIAAEPSLSLAKAPDLSVPPITDRPILHSPQQRIVEPRAEVPSDTQVAPCNMPTWAPRSNLDSSMSSAVPPMSESRSSQSHGVIYVDGSRLGRWVTDRLVKAAEMPRATTTGFDPRMTPTWPGAPVGS